VANILPGPIEVKGFEAAQKKISTEGLVMASLLFIYKDSAVDFYGHVQNGARSPVLDFSAQAHIGHGSATVAKYSGIVSADNRRSTSITSRTTRTAADGTG